MYCLIIEVSSVFYSIAPRIPPGRSNACVECCVLVLGGGLYLNPYLFLHTKLCKSNLFVYVSHTKLPKSNLPYLFARVQNYLNPTVLIYCCTHKTT